MASPLGHALAGFAIGRLAGERPPLPPALVPACALLAVAPDLDFVPGWIAGHPALYHQGASHSFVAAAAVSALAAALVARRGAGFARCFGWLFAAYVSHLLIDWLGTDGRPPLGMPLFWPVSDATYLSPVSVLPGISHSPTGHEGRAAWLASLLAWHNAWALAVELLVAAPLLAVAEWRRRRQRVGWSSDEKPESACWKAEPFSERSSDPSSWSPAVSRKDALERASKNCTDDPMVQFQLGVSRYLVMERAEGRAQMERAVKTARPAGDDDLAGALQAQLDALLNEWDSIPDMGMEPAGPMSAHSASSAFFHSSAIAW